MTKSEHRLLERLPSAAVVSDALDLRIGEMRRLLAAMRPATTASALRTLRDAFPDVPLTERVKALTVLRH